MYQVSAWQAVQSPRLAQHVDFYLACHQFYWGFNFKIGSLQVQAVRTCLQHVNTSTSGSASKAHLESAAETEAFPQYGLQWIFGVTYVLRLQAERIYESNSQIF